MIQTFESFRWYDKQQTTAPPHLRVGKDEAAQHPCEVPDGKEEHSAVRRGSLQGRGIA